MLESKRWLFIVLSGTLAIISFFYSMEYAPIVATYLSNMQKTLGTTFIVAKVVTGFLNIVTEIRISANFIAGAELAPLAFLNKFATVIDGFAEYVFFSLTIITIEKILLGITGTIASVFFTLTTICLLISTVVANAILPRIAKASFGIAIVLYFAIPCMAVSSYVGYVVVDTKMQERIQFMTTHSPTVEEGFVESSATSIMNTMNTLQAQLSTFSKNAEQFSTYCIELIAFFFIIMILFPIAFVYILWKSIQYMLATAVQQ